MHKARAQRGGRKLCELAGLCASVFSRSGRSARIAWGRMITFDPARPAVSFETKKSCDGRLVMLFGESFNPHKRIRSGSASTGRRIRAPGAWPRRPQFRRMVQAAVMQPVERIEQPSTKARITATRFSNGRMFMSSLCLSGQALQIDL